MKDQDALTQLLGLVTDGVTTLDEQGQANWPQVGAEATYLLTEAECAAAFVARQTPVEISVVKGTTLYQNNKKRDFSLLFYAYRSFSQLSNCSNKVMTEGSLVCFKNHVLNSKPL